MKGNYEKTADYLISNGEDLVRLGKAIKNPKTTLKDLVACADKCGLVLELLVAPNEQEEVEE